MSRVKQPHANVVVTWEWNWKTVSLNTICAKASQWAGSPTEAILSWHLSKSEAAHRLGSLQCGGSAENFPAESSWQQTGEGRLIQ
mmetsp:Transcript_1779/g.4002  ORF Transcript_1779/g.4002 Transcript_1779/m.4002 type:complete len:85 (+) Transcript_1779:197-451(+)